MLHGGRSDTVFRSDLDPIAALRTAAGCSCDRRPTTALDVNSIPFGSFPDSVRTAVGVPEDLITNESLFPTLARTVEALVIDGRVASTASVKC